MRGMPGWERALAGAGVAVAVPVSLSVAGWWVSASLALSGLLQIGDTHIAMSALAGLIGGVMLDIVFLGRWVRSFYAVPLVAMVPLYLFWTAIATAWFMGLPFGNLTLGTLAGAYMGRRALHAGADEWEFRRQALVTALVAANVTGLAALGIGLLAMREPYTLAFARRILGLEGLVSAQSADVVIVTGAVLALSVVQFLLCRGASECAFRLGGGD